MTGKKPFVIGLTGSIGMGKTTTAAMFRNLGIDVWDADEAVSRLYGRGGAAVSALAGLNGGLVRDGRVNREALRQWVLDDQKALGRVERIVHPLVARDRRNFLENAQTDIVVLDIPLLFETGMEPDVDLVAVVSAPAAIQRARVLARPGSSEKALEHILSRQIPDEQKRARADIVIPTATLKEAEEAVRKLVREIRAGGWNA